MNETAIYTAVSGIDEAYLADSENVTEIKAGNLRIRKRNRSAAIAACACLLFIFGIVGVAKIAAPQRTEPHTNRTDPTPAYGERLLVPFAANHDPEADAFGEDEIHQVYLSVRGIRYEQLSVEEAAQYGIPETVPDAAFGTAVGTVVESFPNRETEAPVSSPVQSLVGAEVYYYAPTNGSAVLIAEKDGHCAVFAVTQWPAYRPFGESCAFFGAAPTSAGIESIAYTIQTETKTNGRETVEGLLTEADEIDAVCAVLAQLTPEAPPQDESAPTPAWYTAAWEAYKADPEGRAREDITLEIRFRNGCRMANILYQPFLGNGYVDGMKALTPEQNEALRLALK